MKPLKIGIVGAGVGGLAAANFLTRGGHDVTLFDQFDTPRPVGSGLMIQPVGQKVMELIGANTAAQDYGTRITQFEGRLAKNNRRILTLDYARAGADRFGLAIHRASLFDALFQAAQSVGVTISSGHRAVSAHDGMLAFDNDTLLGPFDLIVDSSGAGGTLSPITTRDLPFGALWGTVDMPADSPLNGAILHQRYKAASHMIGIMPAGRLPGETGPKATLFWSLPRDQHAAWRAAPIENWRAQATALWPEIAPFVDQIQTHDDLTLANYRHGRLRRPIGPGIVHIGDAAHQASPQLGQGANMALLDAWALARALKMAPLEHALPIYAQARGGHMGFYQFMSAVFTPLYQSSNPVMPALRDYLLNPLTAIPPAPWILSKFLAGDLLPPIGRLTPT